MGGKGGGWGGGAVTEHLTIVGASGRKTGNRTAKLGRGITRPRGNKT